VKLYLHCFTCLHFTVINHRDKFSFTFYIYLLNAHLPISTHTHTHTCIEVELVTGKSKGKRFLFLTKHHAMKTYWGSRRITRWRWMVSFTPRLLYPQGKSTQYPLDRRLDEPQSRPGRGGEEKIPPRDNFNTLKSNGCAHVA
jgi:hypothetical protein